jgi:enoyl-CoA hydratase
MIPADEAERWGLVNRLCAPGAALDAARDLATEIAQNAPMSLIASKEIIANAGRWPENSLWPRQNEILERVITSQDAREGALAFAEKRPPVWTGR